MIKVVSAEHEEIALLISELDRYQIGLYGIENCHLDSPETLSKQNAFMLGAYDSNGSLTGMGSIKLKPTYAEIKRMYFREASRGSGAAGELIKGLERYAVDNDYARICLETGIHQEAAIKFYQKNGYGFCSAFGEYINNGISVFMEKWVNSGSF